MNSLPKLQSGFLVAGVQMNSQQDIEQNFVTITQVIVEAKSQGAALVVLPENACSMGQQFETAKRFDELSSRFAKLAETHKIYIVAGTLPCPYRPNGKPVSNHKLRQVSLLFSPEGKQVARYDKIHLFQATVSDNMGNYCEADTFEAGTQAVVAPLYIENQTFHIGLMICFDLRFPALAQRLRQMGANILTAPSAFTFVTGQASWSILLQARALDSQCFLVGSAQGGTHHYADGSIRQTWGHVGITRADGALLSYHNASEPTVDKNFTLVFAPFDHIRQQKIRDSLPLHLCHHLL